jgi:hypothetical protein
VVELAAAVGAVVAAVVGVVVVAVVAVVGAVVATDVAAPDDDVAPELSLSLLHVASVMTPTAASTHSRLIEPS